MPSSPHFVAHQFRARPRLIISGLVGALVILLLRYSFGQSTITHYILGWNVGAWLYLLLAIHMMSSSTQETIKKRACQQDEGQRVILVIVIVAAVVSLAAIVVQLAAVKHVSGNEKYAHITLAGLTLLSSWAFTHVMFALHYAHDYYVAVVKGKPSGLDIPGESAPDYWDFLYVAIVIGTSGQTADVSFSSKSMRRVALVHCLVAFMFNTTLLALTINVAASFLQDQ
jgi:uncharacterized membrane protein